MKLIIVLSDDAYEENMSDLFSKANISVFSEMDIKGFKTKNSADQSPSMASNWFTASKYPASSTMNFAFVTEGQETDLMTEIATFNTTIPTAHQIHAFVLNVEQAI